MYLVWDSLASNTEHFFSESEYILADSAYGVNRNVLPVIKRPRGGSLDPQQRRFNGAVSKQQIAVENAFGMLKLQFQCLKELQTNISSYTSMKRALVWVKCSVMLHNMLLDWEGEEFWEDKDQESMQCQWQQDHQEEEECC